MEGRVPRAGGSKQTAHGTKKLHDFHERNTTRARKQKNEQRERQSIHSKSLRLSSPLSSRPPPHLANHRRRNRAGSGRPCRSHSVPSSAEVKPCSKSLPLHFFLGNFRGFWVKVWIFREGGWGGVLRISETTLLERFECGQAEGSEGVEVFNCALAGCQDLSREFWFCFSIWCEKLCDFVPLGFASFLSKSPCFKDFEKGEALVVYHTRPRGSWHWQGLGRIQTRPLFNSKALRHKNEWKINITSSLSRCTTFSSRESNANKSLIWGVPENFEQVYETCVGYLLRK